MAKVYIDIPNMGRVEAVGAASESTLRELARVMANNPNTGSDDNIDVDDANEQLALFGGEVEEAGFSLSQFSKNLVSGTIDSLFNFSGALLFGSNRLTDLAEAVPLLGTPLGIIAGVLDQNIDSFRDAASAGASFGNDMFELRRVANGAGLSVEQFGNLISERSTEMAMFGPSVSAGARSVAELTKNLRTGRVGQTLMGMGFTMETINEGFLNYSELLARQGRLGQMSQQELSQGSANYLMQIDRLAKVTGMQRKEIEQSILAAQQDGKLRLMASQLTGEAADNFNANLAQIEQLGLTDLFADLADGSAQTDEALALMATGAGESALKLAQEFAKGEVGPVEFNNRLAALGPDLDAFFGQFDGAVLDGLKASNPALYNLATAAGKLQQLEEKSATAIENDLNSADPLTQFVGSFEQSITTLRGLIESTFLDSDLFKNLQNIFGEFALESNNLSGFYKEKIKPKLDEFLTQINNFVNEFMQDPTAALTGLKDKIVEGLGSGIKSLFASMLPSWENVIMSTLVGAGTFLLFSNPITGAIAAIAAGVAALFGLENIELPNFMDYLPKWLGGGGKPLSELFGTSATASAPTPDADQALARAEEALPEEPKTAPATRTVNAEKEMDNQLNNNSLNTLIALMQENNRLTKQTMRAISGNADMMIG